MWALLAMSGRGGWHSLGSNVWLYLKLDLAQKTRRCEAAMGFWQ